MGAVDDPLQHPGTQVNAGSRVGHPCAALTCKLCGSKDNSGLRTLPPPRSLGCNEVGRWGLWVIAGMSESEPIGDDEIFQIYNCENHTPQM